MHEIKDGVVLLGIKIDTIAKGSLPITKQNEFIQVVTLKHPKNTVLKAHRHKPAIRKTNKLQECLLVRKGRVRIDLYNSRKKRVKRIFLNSGQAYISLNGGIGIKIIKDAEIIEVKNGPFKEDKELIND